MSAVELLNWLLELYVIITLSVTYPRFELNPLMLREELEFRLPYLFVTEINEILPFQCALLLQ